MSKKEFEEAKQLFLEILVGLAEIKMMLSEFQSTTDRKEQIEILQRRVFYIQ